MVQFKPIKDWENILLDTGIIMALFRGQDPAIKDERYLFVKNAIKFLSTSTTQTKKARKFLISTITISEILSREQDTEKIKRIMKILDSENIEFVDFDLSTSLLFNHDLYPHLANKNMNMLAKEFGFKTGDYMMAREWINRDMMILESAKNANVDIVLSLDKNTFLPLANKINVPCAYCDSRNFEHSHGIMLSFLGNIAN